MKQQLEQRLKELRAEYAAGQKVSVNLKKSRQNLEKHFFE
jgi:biotin operon repressor